MGKEGLYFSVDQDTFLTDEPGTLSTESFSNSWWGGCTQLTLYFHLTMCSLQTCDFRFEAVGKESCFEVVHTFFWKSGLTATFRAMEGLARLCPEGQLEDTLLAVVVETRENLGLTVVLLADGTCDFTLQLLQTLLFYWHKVCHD